MQLNIALGVHMGRLRGLVASFPAKYRRVSLISYAQQTNGLVVSIEHRYFGQSIPFGAVRTNVTTYDWKSLTLDNVMICLACQQFITVR